MRFEVYKYEGILVFELMCKFLEIGWFMCHSSRELCNH